MSYVTTKQLDRYRRRMPASSPYVGQVEPPRTISFTEFTRMAEAEALKDETFSRGYALRNKMSARRKILQGAIEEITRQFSRGLIAPAVAVESHKKLRGLVDDYTGDIVELNVALGASLGEVRRETLRILAEKGYEIPREWTMLAGLGIVVLLTVSAVVLIAAITAGIAIAAPKLADLLAAKQAKELEREKLAFEMIKTGLEKSPEKMKEVVEALKEARLPKVREWYEYLFWAALIGGGAFAAVKLAPLITRRKTARPAMAGV